MPTIDMSQPPGIPEEVQEAASSKAYWDVNDPAHRFTKRIVTEWFNTAKPGADGGVRKPAAFVFDTSKKD